MRLKRSVKNIIFINALFVLLFLAPAESLSRRNFYEEIKSLAGSNGSVYVTDKDNKVILAVNEKKKLVPASIFKIVTASAAYRHLKEDYRFKTVFTMRSKGGALYVSGYGDPLLISEELDIITDKIKEKGVTSVNSIILDNSFFDENIKIDGVENSLNPYDATVGALCVNFNTINVTIDEKGNILSNEEQTPMTEFGREMVRKKLGDKLRRKKRYTERVILSHKKDETLLYVGHLLKEFLTMKGIKVTGEVKRGGRPPKEKMRHYLALHHESTKDLNDIVKSMMKYSNNFTANQVFLTMGAERFSRHIAPATVEKSADTVKLYLKQEFGIADVDIAEGSGISRKNKISAVDFMKILYDYKDKHFDTLSENGGAYYKTGTLKDVKSAAGYMKGKSGDIYNFIIMLNDERDVHKRGKIIKAIKGIIRGES
jgi:D-alanyl-D-alanine carboxypeptidase/D-alanyl-D-alanine-endopeptidase (penicillin-binding protein 4)